MIPKYFNGNLKGSVGICPNCSKDVIPSYKFCPECGTDLHWDIAHKTWVKCTDCKWLDSVDVTCINDSKNYTYFSCCYAKRCDVTDFQDTKNLIERPYFTPKTIDK